MTSRIAIIAIGILAMLASMIWIDLPLATWINAHNTSELRQIGSGLEELGKSQWILGYCLIVTLVAWRSMRSFAKQHIAFFVSVAASGILSNVIKVILCRPRPPLFIEQGITQWHLLGFQMEYIWNSFPSGHATTGLAIAISGSAAYPRLKWLFWSVGLAIVLGRLMLNAHYLSDVIAGSLLGGVVAMWILRRFSTAA
ncbi:MAG: phosphatase PAP2 family protein [Candidatus Kapabacteria bacterium]|nr:phosphatase PAP2 family protein [Candidatus Kapabacteria bacterium]